jgi:hypothetical protein
MVRLTPLRKFSVLRALCCLLLSASIGIPTSIADDAPLIYAHSKRTSLGSMVDRSDQIARVRILDREPQFIGDPGKSGVCGYIYTARAITSLKGASKTFHFFATDNAQFIGADHDYLVFIFRRNPKQARIAIETIRDSLSMAILQRLLCVNSQEFFVPSFGRLFLPIATRSGSEWLGSRADDNMWWCVPDEYQPAKEKADPLESLREEKGFPDGVSWVQAVSLIHRALTAKTVDVHC